MDLELLLSRRGERTTGLRGSGEGGFSGVEESLELGHQVG